MTLLQALMQTEYCLRVNNVSEVSELKWGSYCIPWIKSLAALIDPTTFRLRPVIIFMATLIPRPERLGSHVSMVGEKIWEASNSVILNVFRLRCCAMSSTIAHGHLPHFRNNNFLRAKLSTVLFNAYEESCVRFLILPVLSLKHGLCITNSMHTDHYVQHILIS